MAVDNHLGQVTAVPTSAMMVRIDDKTLVVRVALSLKSQRLKMAWSFLLRYLDGDIEEIRARIVQRAARQLMPAIKPVNLQS